MIHLYLQNNDHRSISSHAGGHFDSALVFLAPSGLLDLALWTAPTSSELPSMLLPIIFIANQLMKETST